MNKSPGKSTNNTVPDTEPENTEPRKSALSRTVRDERDGDKQLQIVISSDGKGGWLLEVVDKHRNTTQWEDPFKTEQEALDEALAAIEQEGIDIFIGPPGGYGSL